MRENEVTTSTAGEPGTPAGADQSTDSPPPSAPENANRLMVAVTELAAHPGNVREDLELTPEFCASIANAGVRVPLLITLTSDGGYQVVEGHRRLSAAIQAGLETVPCDLDPSRAGDEAGQYMDMLLANSDTYRRNFAPVEEATVLFAAHEAGATRTRLRKATGRKAEEIKTALKAGQLSQQTREAAGDLARQLDLNELALLAEFDDDPGAVSQLLDARQRGYPMDYTAERIRQDRAEAAEHQRLAEELQAGGFQITDEVPPGGMRLSQLQHDGQDLTPEAHGDCPGRGVYFPHWNLTQPVHYCASPQEHGHTPLSQVLSRQHGNSPAVDGEPGTTDESGDPVPGGFRVQPADEQLTHARRLVIEGNKAWQAAAEVRKRWLAEVLFARRNAPREVAQFVARQLLSMPEPLHSGLTVAPGRIGFTEITRQDAGHWLGICDTAPASRLPLLMLAPIATTYEYAMTEGLGRATWRTDNTYSPCPRAGAGNYLSFLASLGYQLTPIERAVAESVPYTGDDPDDQLTTEDAGAGATEVTDPAEQAGDEPLGHDVSAHPAEDSGSGDIAPGGSD